MKKILSYAPKLWWPLVIISAVTVFTVSMLFSIGQSIWFDEGYSILLAKASWPEVFALAAVDAHPPLYYVLLKIWGSLFGFNEFALRSLSGIFLAAAVVMGAVLLRKMFSAKVALLVLPVFVLAPFMLRYGYEVRMYAMALLIGVTATYYLVLALQQNKRSHWILCAILVALGVYTLYMTLVVWLAHAVWLLVRTLKAPKRKGEDWRWLWVYIGSVLLFLPQIPTFLYQTINSALPGVGNEITLTILVDIVTVLLTFTPEWQMGGWLSLLIVAALTLTIWTGCLVYRKLSAKEKSAYGLLVMLVVVPLVFYALSSLPPREPIFVIRYLAHISLFMYALLGVTLAFGLVHRASLGAQRVVPVVAYTLVLITLLVGTVQLYKTGNYIFERNQTPYTQQLRSAIVCDEETTILAVDPYTYIDSVYYFDGCDIRFFSESAIEKKGGYAPLHNSAARISTVDDVTAKTLIVLGWEGSDLPFETGSRYEFVEATAYGSQKLTTFRLIEG